MGNLNRLSSYFSCKLSWFILIAAIAFVWSCSTDNLPKPRGFFRIQFPEKEYQPFDSTFPYTFQYPIYGVIEPDRSRIAEKYWINIHFPAYKARIHLSYKNASGRLDSLIEDSRRLTYKHAAKADAISERYFVNDSNRVYGILYEVKGDVASSWQFFVTDSTKHFLRGALYFSVTPNKDSLAPAIDFFGQDLMELMETVRWKK
jgi:gliding motility-associated lipoprotein GldD